MKKCTTKKGRKLDCHRSYGRIHPLYFTGHGVKIAQTVDLRPKDSPIVDQGTQNGCTANAACGLTAFLQKKYGIRPNNPGNPFLYSATEFMAPSRDFVYYCERVIDGDPSQDAGSYLSTSAQAWLTYGAPSEVSYPYGQQNLFAAPPAAVYDQAASHKIRWALPIENEDSNAIMACLSEGFPVIYGFSVYDQYENVGPDGIIDYPSIYDSPLGGHANMLVGYLQISGQPYFITRNSWGTSWAASGYAYMPADYITNQSLASDFWTFR